MTIYQKETNPLKTWQKILLNTIMTIVVCLFIFLAFTVHRLVNWEWSYKSMTQSLIVEMVKPECRYLESEE